MTFLHIVALATLTATSALAAPQLVRRCDVPGVNAGVRDQIFQVALSRGLTPDSLCMEVMFVTAIQESNVNNLDCGDKDSLGVFQQRPSQGWGTPAQLQDPTYSANKFLDVAIPICNSHPDEDAGVIAQEVQVSEAGNFYTQHEDEARQLIADAVASVGAVNVGSSPTKQPAPSSTSSSDPAPTSSAPSDGGDDGCDDDGDLPSDIPDNCDQTYTPVGGDTCDGVSSKFNISLSQFYSMNPSIASDCSNLEVSRPYCVGLSS